MIPYFGVDVGGITQRNLGHHFQASPHLGLYLWTSRNVFVSISGAYQIVPSRLDTLGGWRASAGLNLTLWSVTRPVLPVQSLVDEAPNRQRFVVQTGLWVTGRSG